MTPDTENLAARIDRDRRDRERELLALLLLLFWQARQHVYSAIRVNADPFRAAADVLQGAPHAGPGLAPRLAAELALAERAGYRRTLLVLPGEPQQPPPAGTDWRWRAQQYVSQLTQTLLARLQKALVGAYGKGPRGLQDAIRQAFAAGGYVDGTPRPWLAETLAETWALRAYNGGMLTGWTRSEVAAAGLTGFEHVSVEDERTSDICREHDHTKRPADDPFWLYNTPPLHFRCRSWLRPLFGPFTATDLPVIPPDPGFGAAPLIQFGRVMYPVAA